MDVKNEEFVLIGFVDEPISKYDDQKLNWKVNKIGGSIKFSNCFNYDWNQLKLQLKCTFCDKLNLFIGQIYCPIDSSLNERVIYFFGCPTCNKFKALRYSELSMEHEVNQLQNGINRLWSNEESWSDNEYENHKNNITKNDITKNDNSLPNQIKQQNLNLDLKAEGIIKFKSFYILVEEEKFLKECQDESFSKIEIDLTRMVNDNCDEEEYEKSGRELFQNDLLSYKFYKKLNANPRQIIRYSWKGSPLLNRSNLNINPSNCEKCGSKRLFEFQLMPGLIYFLKSSDFMQCKFDFGTVLVFTCSQDCRTEPINMEECIVLKDLDSDAIEKWASNF